MYERFDDRARKVMQQANLEAQRLHHEYIGTEHLLLGLVLQGPSPAIDILRNKNIDLAKISREIEKIIQPGPAGASPKHLFQTPRMKKVIEYAIDEARALQSDVLGTEFLLLGLLRDEEGVASQVLKSLGLTFEEARAEVVQRIEGSPSEKSLALSKVRAGRTPVMDAFGLDLTELARQGKLPPVVGRHDDVERLRMVLGCHRQNNALLVGEVGVGKSAIVRALAHALAADEGTGPRLVAIGLDLLTWVEKSVELHERVKALLEEVRRSKKVVLFLDDLDPLLRVAPTEGAAYLRSGFRSALARHEIQCIAIATPAAFRSGLANDSVLARVFQPLFVLPPSRVETLEIVRGARQLYETHHRIQIADDALLAAVEFSDHYFPERSQPGKALQLLDDAGAYVRIRLAVPPPDLRNLEQERMQLNQAKEQAVAAKDFKKAAMHRDKADRLLKRKQSILREYQLKSQEATGVVDRVVLAEVVRKITGQRVEPTEPSL
jgi:ATP-dependent Clp protease ATP-binding subunit ClpC